MDAEERRSNMDQVAARFKADDVFRQALLEDPARVLKAEGFDIPSYIDVRAVPDASGDLQLMVRRAEGELSDDDLMTVAGGAGPACRSWLSVPGYRVWSANRRVFLYPENWIEPDVR